jgi:hypothetical protein
MTKTMANERSRTPGPWRYDVESEAVFYDDGDVCPNVAFMNDNTSGAQNLADGTLIAAAPDLLAALESLLQAVCGETGFANAVRVHSGTAYPWPALDAAEELARDAIARTAPS